jgi:lipopolysaccharide export LptBFGC system permease protein LptF
MNDKERFSSPLSVYAAYMLASLLVIAGYRWFFPGAAEPLKPFFLKWRIVAAFIDFAALYPALAFSALVIPFGLKEHSGSGYAGGAFVGDKSFSPRFLQYLFWPVITACIAAALYAVVFFMLLPIAGNMKQSMINRAGLFHSALEKAGTYAAAGEWAEASRFLAIGEGIWPDNKEINKLKTDYGAGISSYHEQVQKEAETGPEKGDPLNSAAAMVQAETAFAEERWYDAHWLATLAERLASPGSAGIPAAQALAARAWNKIAELAPNAREKERYALYRLKQDGYNAMLERDWISAYYIFKELSALTPKDPDVAHYLEDSTRGLAEVAFFIDEIDLALGTVFRNPVFSLPSDSQDGGRIVVRFSSMALLPDYAYVWEPELVAVDKNGLFLYRARSDYGKLVPVSISTLEEKPREQTALLLRALDRSNNDKRLEPVWTNEEGEAVDSGSSQILFNLNFNDFILLSRALPGPDGLGLRELFDAEKRLSGYGFVPEVFKAEILRRLAEPVFFLPLSVFALFLGWRFRARKKPRYVYLPMLGVLPLVFYHASLFLRSVFNNLAIWLSLSVGFPTALVCFVAASAVCFILALVVLAAQHG